MTVWFKSSESSEWKSGEIVHWSNVAEKYGDYSYANVSAIVSDFETGWVYAVPIELLSFNSTKPVEEKRPEVGEWVAAT